MACQPTIKHIDLTTKMLTWGGPVMSQYIPHGAAIPSAETTFQMREDCVRGHIMQQHGQARAYNIIVQLEIKLNSRYLHSTPKESIHFVTLRVLKRKDPLKPKTGWD